MDPYFSFTVWICLNLNVFACNLYSLCGSMFFQALHNWDSYPWERGAELRNVQVGHQGNSETVGEHQVGSYCIHYHSVRHGTANECKMMLGTHGREGETHAKTNRQRLYTTADHMNMHKITWYSGSQPTGSTHWLNMRAVVWQIMLANVIWRRNTIKNSWQTVIESIAIGNWCVSNKCAPLTML